MSFDPRSFMPFDMGRYLVMLFVTGGAIMACLFVGELLHGKKWLALLIVAAVAWALWEHFAGGGHRLRF